jgi:3-methyladenine DNA glycosylase/8-oxoguanine DNA glycosylase
MTFATIDGPAWLSVDARGVVDHGGPGAGISTTWAADPNGQRDHFVALEAVHPLVNRLQVDHGHVRIGASGDVYKSSLTATLGQRITAAEAVRQWARLCQAFGEPIDTPSGKLISPPKPQTVAALVPFQLHRFGIEEARARSIIAIARVFSRTGTHHTDPGRAFERICADAPRFGPWTRALVAAEAFGDPDAVPVGDFHLKNVVAHALTGRPRGSDEEMLEALAPYAGQRGRVLMWLGLGGVSAPKFGPRRTNPDIRRL